MLIRFTVARISLLIGLCLGACTAPDQARSRLGQAVIPAEYHSPDDRIAVRLRGGTPAIYQVVRARDGRVLSRAQSAIKEDELHTEPPTPNRVNVVFAPDDAVICVEEELGGGSGPASRYLLFRANLVAEHGEGGYTVSYLRPEANQWSLRRAHYGEAYEWPEVLALDRTAIRFYYPRSKQGRNVSLDSIHAVDQPTTQE